jgi:hypothetical protein
MSIKPEALQSDSVKTVTIHLSLKIPASVVALIRAFLRFGKLTLLQNKLNLEVI